MTNGEAFGVADLGGASPVTLRVIEIFDSLQGEGYWTGVPMTFVRLAGCNAPDLGLDCVRWCDTTDAWSVRAGEDVDVSQIVDRLRFPRMCLTGGEPLLQREGVAALLEAAHAADIRVHVETNGTIGPELPPAGSAAVGAGGRDSRGGAPGGAGLAGTVGDKSGSAGPGGSADPGGPAGRGAAACLEFDWVVVSPKPPDYLVAAGWDDLIDELKLVADESLDAATAERLAAAYPGAFIGIQPVAAPRGAGRSAAGRLGAAGAADPADASIQRAVDLVMSHPEWRLSVQTHKFLGLR